MADPEHILFLASLLKDRAHRFIQAEFARRSIHGLDPAHGAILHALAVHGPQNMTELARRTGRTKPTITTLVRKLADHGYVERGPDPHDGRVIQVHLTAAAEALKEDLRDISRRIRERIGRGLSAGDQRTLADLLDRAVRNFSGG
jgi:DNA-binding MarR family transcriptional regulator